jgi:hypothetical protein
VLGPRNDPFNTSDGCADAGGADAGDAALGGARWRKEEDKGDEAVQGHSLNLYTLIPLAIA